MFLKTTAERLMDSGLVDGKKLWIIIPIPFLLL